MKKDLNISREKANPSHPRAVSNKGNYLILLAIFLLSALLKGIGFPIWVVLIFGLGMSFTLFVLSLIRGVQIEMNLKNQKLEELYD